MALGARRIAVFDGNRPLAQALLLTRARITATLRGLPPLWHADTSPTDRIAALRTLRCAGLRLVEAEDATSADILRAAGFRMVATPAHVAELDLTPDVINNRRRALDGKWRNCLTHAEAAGLTLHRRRTLTGPSDPLLLAELAQRRTRGYRALPPAFATAFPDAEVAEARQNGTPAPAMLFLRHGQAATYHIAHTTTAGRKADAHRLLLWDAMNHLAAEGRTRLDLGTIDTVTAPDLARFKLALAPPPAPSAAASSPSRSSDHNPRLCAPRLPIVTARHMPLC